MANVPYIEIKSLNSQVIAGENIPQLIAFDVIEDSNDVTYNNANGEIKVKKAGKYLFSLACQVGRKGDCQLTIPNFRCWIKKNNVDLPNSNVLLNVNNLRLTKDIILNQGIITLEKDDTIKCYMSSSVKNEVQIESINFAGEPKIPSVNFVLYKLGIDSDEKVGD